MDDSNPTVINNDFFETSNELLPHDHSSSSPTSDFLTSKNQKNSQDLDQMTRSQSFEECINADRSEINEENVVSLRENNVGKLRYLDYISEFILKTIGFQFNLIVYFAKFPFWVLYYSFMLVVNPIYVVGIGKLYLINKVMGLCSIVYDLLSPFLLKWLTEYNWVLRFVFGIGWGMFWSVSLCWVFLILLVSAFVISGLMTKFYLVKQPFQLQQTLNFDYTKHNPVAFVPITVCPNAESASRNELRNAKREGVVPHNHKLQATVTLVLPESDYNRNLGMFQVRVDFLSENGKTLASLSQPCILGFRSHPIRLLSIFLKIIPLITGYVAESQTINLKFRTHNGVMYPTACLKVSMEQRAEVRAGGGIPELYDAYLLVESRLPFFKGIIWRWRIAFFVCLSLMIFVSEVLFALLCCGFFFPKRRYATRRG